MPAGPRPTPYPVVVQFTDPNNPTTPVKLLESSSIFVQSLSAVTISATNYLGLTAVGGGESYLSALLDVDVTGNYINLLPDIYGLSAGAILYYNSSLDKWVSTYPNQITANNPDFKFAYLQLDREFGEVQWYDPRLNDLSDVTSIGPYEGDVLYRYNNIWGYRSGALFKGLVGLFPYVNGEIAGNELTVESGEFAIFVSSPDNSILPSGLITDESGQFLLLSVVPSAINDKLYLSSLGDTTIAVTPNEGNILAWNGTAWVASALGAEDIPGGDNYTIQFRYNNSFSGSPSLIWDVNSNGLSGTNATIQNLSASIISATEYRNLPISSHSQLLNLTALDHPQYATTASLDSYATTASLGQYETTSYARVNYATTGQLNSYALTATLASYATTASLNSYETTAYARNNYLLTSINVTSLAGTSTFETTAYSRNNFATTASLNAYETTSYARNNYATTGQLQSYALTASLGAYATTASLNAYETTSYARNNYATTASLASYETTSYARANYLVTSINVTSLNGTGIFETTGYARNNYLVTSVNVTSLNGTGTFEVTAYSRSNYLLTSINVTSLAGTSTFETTAYARNNYLLTSINVTSLNGTGIFETTAYSRNNYLLTSVNVTSLNGTATFETTAYARNNYLLTSVNVTSLAGTSTFETTAYSRNTFATTASLGSYVLTSINTVLSSTVSNHISSAVHWELSTLNNNYINASGDSVTGSFIFGTVSAATISATNYSGISLSGSLRDVIVTSTPTTNYVLTWNGTNWIPKVAPGAAGGAKSIDELSDVDPNTVPPTGDPDTYGLLNWNAGTQLWEGIAAASWLAGTENLITHNNIGGLTTGNPHTQYATLSGSTFTGQVKAPSISATDYFNLPSGTALWNANKLQGVSVTATAPSNQQALIYNGSVWTPSSLPSPNTPAAGSDKSVQFNNNGSFSGVSQFTYTANTETLQVPTVSATNYYNLPSGSPIWDANQIQNVSVTATAPAANQVLMYNGTNWLPSSMPYVSAALTANIAMANNNTFVVGPSATITPGVWFVMAHLTLNRSTTTAATYTGRIILDGTTTVASTSQYHPSVAGNSVNMAMTCIVGTGANATIGIRSATTAGAATTTLNAQAASSGDTNTATQICAFRLS